MKNKGRPRIENYVSVERILKAYQVHKTVLGTSRALCIDPKTLRRVLNEQGVEINKPTYVDLQKYGAMSRREGCLVKWLKGNPGVRLPARISEIAKVTGCSYDAVKCYLKRRRDAVKEMLHALPDVRGSSGSFQDTLGYFIAADSIEEYRFRVNKYSCDVYIVAKLKDGTYTEIHIENVRDFETRLKELLR